MQAALASTFPNAWVHHGYVPWTGHMSLQQIFKTTQFLLELTFSKSTTVWHQASLHKTLKILGLKVLQAKIASFCVFLEHEGDLTLAGAVKKKALFLCGSQVNIKKRTILGEEGFL